MQAFSFRQPQQRRTDDLAVVLIPPAFQEPPQDGAVARRQGHVQGHRLHGVKVGSGGRSCQRSASAGGVIGSDGQERGRLARLNGTTSRCALTVC